MSIYFRAVNALFFSFFLAILALISPARSFAEDLSLFGVRLGSGIGSIVPCSNESQGNCVYKTEHGKNGDRVSVYVPEKPVYFSSNLNLFVVDGLIESISIDTLGIDLQDEVLGMLTAKFGKPEKMEKVQIENSYGLKLWKIESHWSFGNADLVFHGATDRIREGRVVLSSEKYHALTK